MKAILSTILAVLFFTGCSSLNLSKTSVDSKEQLIQNAQNGDIHAMVMLNKHYKFPQTKEGLYYFEKWYKSIDEKDNAKDIYEVANIYNQYNDMFINGKDRTIKLYVLASNLGYKKADLKHIEMLLKAYKERTARKIEKKILPKLKQEQLEEMYTIYKSNYSSSGARRIAKYMRDNGFEVPFQYTLEELRKNMYKKHLKAKFDNKINEIIDTKNTKNIYELAYFLQRKYKYEKALFVYKELIKLDKNNDKAYQNMGYIYSKKRDKETREQDKLLVLESYEKASSLGNKEASVKLLKIYSQEKKYLDKFFALKNRLQKTTDGQLIIAKYYKEKRLLVKSNELYDQLAQEGNHEAILHLALIIQSRYNFTPETQIISQKWQNYLDTTTDIVLEEKYKKRLLEYKYKKVFKDRLEKYIQKDIEERNILTLRTLFKNNKYNDPKKAMKYIQLAVEAGDVKSTKDLAKYYMYNKKYKDFNKVAQTLDTLVQRGDIEATRKLADLYLRPPSFFKRFADPKRGLEYYENLANSGDISAIRKLADAYICDDCYNGNIVNYKKGLVYLKKLHERGEPRASATIGWLYNLGNGVEKDLFKAQEYYETASKNGYSPAYYYLAWLYYKDKKSIIEPIRVDYKKAMEYLQMGAKKYNAKCINLIGVFYENGYGVEKDIEEAATYYKKVARYNPFASYHLGIYYKNKKDYENAYKQFNSSAKRGSSASMIQVGIIHEKGLLGKVDMEKAIEAYTKAYKNDKDPNAAYNIAIIYHYEKGGIKKDVELARSWYLKSNIKLAKKHLAILNKEKK